MQTSTKRWESKHRDGTLAAHASNSRIDLLFTLSIKSQLKYCYQLLARKGLNLDFVTSMGSVSRAEDVPLFEQFGPLLNIGVNGRISTFEFVEYGGTLYKVKMVVIHELGQYFPRFASIENIVIHGNGELSFVKRILRIINFDNHFHAFRVEMGDEFYCKHPKRLVSYQPLWMRHGIRNGSFVSLQFAV